MGNDVHRFGWTNLINKLPKFCGPLSDTSRGAELRDMDAITRTNEQIRNVGEVGCHRNAGDLKPVKAQ